MVLKNNPEIRADAAIKEATAICKWIEEKQPTETRTAWLVYMPDAPIDHHDRDVRIYGIFDDEKKANDAKFTIGCGVHFKEDGYDPKDICVMELTINVPITDNSKGIVVYR